LQIKSDEPKMVVLVSSLKNTEVLQLVVYVNGGCETVLPNKNIATLHHLLIG